MPKIRAACLRVMYSGSAVGAGVRFWSSDFTQVRISVSNSCKEIGESTTLFMVLVFEPRSKSNQNR